MESSSDNINEPAWNNDHLLNRLSPGINLYPFMGQGGLFHNVIGCVRIHRNPGAHLPIYLHHPGDLFYLEKLLVKSGARLLKEKALFTQPMPQLLGYMRGKG